LMMKFLIHVLTVRVIVKEIVNNQRSGLRLDTPWVELVVIKDI